jgi:hypothetical protein
MRMLEIEAQWVADAPGLRLGHDLKPHTLGGGVPRFWLRDATVHALDDHLQPVRQAAVPEGALLTATPDLEIIVLAGKDAVTVLIAGREVRLEIESADSAVVLDATRLLITAPQVHHEEHRGRPYDSRGVHLVHLVELPTGRILDRVVVEEVVDAGMFAIPHPHDGSVLLDAGMGQDGSALFIARAHDTKLTVDLLTENMIMGSFTPAGDRALLTPHPCEGSEITVVAWPSGRPVATMDDSSVDAEFTLYACFLANERVLLQTYDDGLLLCDDQLTPQGWVRLYLPDGTPGPDPTMVLALAENLFAVESSTGTTVWRLPPPPPQDPLF